MFVIKRRSTGKIAVRDNEGQPVFFPNREEAKPTRDRLNQKYYKSNPSKSDFLFDEKNGVPMHNREYYISRSFRHRLGKVQ